LLYTCQISKVDELFCKRFPKDFQIAQAMPKAQGNMIFDLGTQLENELVFHQEGTCFHFVSKFQEHVTKVTSLEPTQDFL